MDRISTQFSVHFNFWRQSQRLDDPQNKQLKIAEWKAWKTKERKTSFGVLWVSDFRQEFPLKCFLQNIIKSSTLIMTMFIFSNCIQTAECKGLWINMAVITQYTPTPIIWI